jgi:hypothetical protein
VVVACGDPYAHTRDAVGGEKADGGRAGIEAHQSYMQRQTVAEFWFVAVVQAGDCKYFAKAGTVGGFQRIGEARRT